MKALLRVGHTEYVLELSKAVQILELLEGALVYEACWHSGNDKYDGKSYHTYHVYENEEVKSHLETLPDSYVNMLRLAGKPERK